MIRLRVRKPPMMEEQDKELPLLHKLTSKEEDEAVYSQLSCHASSIPWRLCWTYKTSHTALKRKTKEKMEEKEEEAAVPNSVIRTRIRCCRT